MLIVVVVVDVVVVVVGRLVVLGASVDVATLVVLEALVVLGSVDGLVVVDDGDVVLRSLVGARLELLDDGDDSDCVFACVVVVDRGLDFTVVAAVVADVAAVGARLVDCAGG